MAPGRLEKFPRSHRYGLGQRIENCLFDVFEGLVRAKYAGIPQKQGELAAVNVELETLRMLTRLAPAAELVRGRMFVLGECKG